MWNYWPRSWIIRVLVKHFIICIAHVVALLIDYHKVLDVNGLLYHVMELLYTCSHMVHVWPILSLVRCSPYCGFSIKLS